MKEIGMVMKKNATKTDRSIFIQKSVINMEKTGQNN
jgi:hypothetical protein